MSFDGDLEHIPIVDVIQLLHATRKSGTLTLRSLKGESQIVFHSGYIVSANHVNNSLRIGQILIEMKMITYEDLESALEEQQKAGPARKPIIQTMIEAGKIRTEDAYEGLEVLLEMTIVEVLTWTRGTFSLDVDEIFVSDEYRYFPEQLKKELQLNTQNVLMDALRIYDERKRDGTLSSEEIFTTPQAPAPAAPPAGTEISAADLGLDELDSLERKIATPFAGLDQAEPDSPRFRLQRALAGIAPAEQERLFSYLEELAKNPGLPGEATGVILYTGDKLVRECVAAACGSGFRCAIDDAAALDLVIDQSLSKGVVPLLLLDPGEPGTRRGDREAIIDLARQKREKYPQIGILLLVCPGDFRLTTQALQTGLRAVLPRSSREERPESYITDSIDCTEVLSRQLKELATAAAAPAAPATPASASAAAASAAPASAAAAASGPGTGAEAVPAALPLTELKAQFLALAEQREPAEATFRLLQAVGGFFDRALTLVVVRSELISERGIGMDGAATAGPVKLRLPLTGHSLFQQVVSGGESYFGAPDQVLGDTLFAAIGAPASPEIMLLPVLSFGRVIALIYADLGARAGALPPRELLEMLALHAGLVIDNALYRKRAAQKPAQ